MGGKNNRGRLSSAAVTNPKTRATMSSSKSDDLVSRYN